MTATALPVACAFTDKPGAFVYVLNDRRFGHGLLCAVCDEVLGKGDDVLCPRCSFPPISGGSDAATAEIGCHADSFDEISDSFHSGDDSFSLASLPPLSGPSEPIAAGADAAEFPWMAPVNRPETTATAEYCAECGEHHAPEPRYDDDALLALIAELGPEASLRPVLHAAWDAKGMAWGRAFDAYERLKAAGRIELLPSMTECRIRLAGEELRKYDRAFESSRSVGIEMECPTEPPARFDAIERAGWAAGQVEAGAVIHARYQEMVDTEMEVAR